MHARKKANPRHGLHTPVLRQPPPPRTLRTYGYDKPGSSHSSNTLIVFVLQFNYIIADTSNTGPGEHARARCVEQQQQ